MPIVTASVVRIHDGRHYKDGDAAGYGSGDPSALAYLPGLNALFIADSEHDESPYLSSTNLFAMRPDGTFVGAYSLSSFTSEPTGLAYNTKNGYLYVADDDLNEVFWVDPAYPSVVIGQFDTAIHGITDTEDLKFDPSTGHMFILDGVARRLFTLTDQGVFVRSMALPTVMRDAEALAYHPTHDVFFVASGISPTIWMMGRTGDILATIDILSATSYLNPVNGAAPAPKGLELAPSSDPNDGTTLSLYVADYGKDQQHDGRVFEISLGPDWLAPPPGHSGPGGSSPGPGVLGIRLTGTAGNDTIMLGRGNNQHLGAGNDTIEGLAGSDRLGGAGGNDTIYGGAGHDWIYGEAGRDWIHGGSGNDRIFGGLDNDTLSGSSGSDRFVFDTRLGTSKTDRKVNFDTIKDFSVKYDSLWLDNAIFKKLGKGTLAKPGGVNEEFFTIGSKALEKDDYLIYNKKTGVLSYDSDGSGSKAAVEFAQLSKNLKLTYKDFFVI